MSTVRKLAREAVIFMLLGLVVTAAAVFGFLQHRSVEDVKAEAARGVYAIDSVLEKPRPPDGFMPVNSVLVPLTNGVQLYVTDCAQAHPWVVSSVPLDSKSTDLPAGLKPLPPVDSGSKRFERILPGATNGSDCFYFPLDEKDEKFRQLGGRMVSVSLGDENQVAIEKDYWLAYAKAKSQHRVENMMAAAVLSLWGFPAGIIVWLFYRLVRFAVKG
jgi:hypothetical protein